jgi:hypothetical protein
MLLYHETYKVHTSEFSYIIPLVFSSPIFQVPTQETCFQVAEEVSDDELRQLDKVDLCVIVSASISLSVLVVSGMPGFAAPFSRPTLSCAVNNEIVLCDDGE